MNIKVVGQPTAPYIGPRPFYGTLPRNRNPNPFWYMQNRDPTMVNALMAAFQQPGKIVKSKVNRQRRPFNAHRGY